MFGIFALARVFAIIIGFVLFSSMSQAQTGSSFQNCWNCHGSEPKYPVAGIRAQYMASRHKSLGNFTYANGGGRNDGFCAPRRR